MSKLSPESNARVTRAKMRLNEAQIEEAISGHEARNAALRRVFIEKGVDCGEPRLVECHFGAWSKEDAAGLAEALTVRGFRVLVQGPAASSDDPYLWNIGAGIEQSIEVTVRRGFTDELVRVAAAHSGEYDGWGTSVRPAARASGTEEEEAPRMNRALQFRRIVEVIVGFIGAFIATTLLAWAVVWSLRLFQSTFVVSWWTSATQLEKTGLVLVLDSVWLVPIFFFWNRRRALAIGFAMYLVYELSVASVFLIGSALH